MKISAAIVTWNEQKNIERAIRSIKPFVDEVVVVDMSTDPDDKTPILAKKLGARVFKHEYTGYVEPARNFSIQKSSGDWIFILDADEEIPRSLGSQLKKLAGSEVDYYELPRKNIVFGKWLEHSLWWPDYLVRFFKKGHLAWPHQIHKQPEPRGKGVKLESHEENAIIHNHYESISQYLIRMNRYTDHQLTALQSSGYIFQWRDIIKKPTNEFLSRFYYGQGYLDGIHGLALALLQSFSELVLYLKVWEQTKFADQNSPAFKSDLEKEVSKSVSDWKYWVAKKGNLYAKIKHKLNI